MAKYMDASLYILHSAFVNTAVKIPGKIPATQETTTVPIVSKNSGTPDKLVKKAGSKLMTIPNKTNSHLINKF